PGAVRGHREPGAVHAGAVGVPGLHVARVPVERRPAEGDLLLAVLPLHLADQALVDALDLAVGGRRRPLLGAVGDAGGERRLGAVLGEQVERVAVPVGDDVAEVPGLPDGQRDPGLPQAGPLLERLVLGVPLVGRLHAAPRRGQHQRTAGQKPARPRGSSLHGSVLRPLIAGPPGPPALRGRPDPPPAPFFPWTPVSGWVSDGRDPGGRVGGPWEAQGAGGGEATDRAVHRPFRSSGSPSSRSHRALRPPGNQGCALVPADSGFISPPAGPAGRTGAWRAGRGGSAFRRGPGGWRRCRTGPWRAGPAR